MKKAYTQNIWWALFAALFFFSSIFCFADGNPVGGIVCLGFGIPAIITYVILTKKAVEEQKTFERWAPVLFNAMQQAQKRERSATTSNSPPASPSLTKEQEQGKWCFSIEKIGEIAKAQYKASISDSYEEQLEWAVYFGFQLYVAICNIRRDANFATAFLDWYKYFLKTDWRAPHEIDESFIQKIIDTRLNTYDDIMQAAVPASEKNQRLQDALVQFIAKGRTGDPFTAKIAILPIDKMFSLTLSLTTLYAKTTEEAKPLWDYVSGTSFYIRYTEEE